MGVSGVEARAGERVDRCAGRARPEWSRADAEEAVREGRVRVDGRTERSKGRRLAGGERIEVEDRPAPAAGCRLPDVEVLYEDETVVAVNKPAGVPTQPVRAGETGTLSQAMAARWPELSWGGADGAGAVLHRLDIGTSGVVLAARSAEAWRALREQFRAQTVEKHYWAVVEGRIGEGESRLPLTHASRSPCRMRVVGVDARGRLDARGDILPAATRWTPLRAGPDWTWLDVCIRSGVTHQIRCHLASAGHPLAGDALYGAATPPPFFLHARSVEWRAPGGETLRATAPAPEAFRARVEG